MKRLIAFVALFAASLVATSTTAFGATEEFLQIFTYPKVKVTLNQSPDGSVTARVVYSSKYPQCLKPGKITTNIPGEPVPSMGFVFDQVGGGRTYPLHSVNNYRLKLVGRDTYELTTLGSTGIPVPLLDEFGDPKVTPEPLSSFSSTLIYTYVPVDSFFTRLHGEKASVHCVFSENYKQFPL